MALPTEGQLRDVFTGEFGDDRLLVEVQSVDTSNEEVVVRGVLRDPDSREKAGDFHRVFSEPDGELEVFNHGLHLKDEYQSHGFDSGFTAHTDRALAGLGVVRARVTAGDTEGGSHWARSYDFDEERLAGFGAAEREADQLGVGLGGRNVVLSENADPMELRREIVDAILVAALNVGRITEREYDQLVAMRDQLLWPVRFTKLKNELGRRVLRGARWPGVKPLER